MYKILVVDDDQHIGNLLEELLSQQGYQVARAYSCTEALLRLEESPPDLVLLDLMLPGLTGEELLPHIDAIIVSRAHNMNIYVEFTSLDDVGAIIGRIKEQGARIYEVDIIQDRKESALYPCAVFSIRLSQPRTHGRMIMAIYELDRVIAIDEV